MSGPGQKDPYVPVWTKIALVPLDESGAFAIVSR
jgi:hypothetical protein